MFGFDPKCSNASQSVQSNLGYLYFKDILEYFRCICFGHLWVSQCFAKLRIQPTTMTEAEADTPEWWCFTYTAPLYESERSRFSTATLLFSVDSDGPHMSPLRQDLVCDLGRNSPASMCIDTVDAQCREERCAALNSWSKCILWYQERKQLYTERCCIGYSRLWNSFHLFTLETQSYRSHHSLLSRSTKSR